MAATIAADGPKAFVVSVLAKQVAAADPCSLAEFCSERICRTQQNPTEVNRSQQKSTEVNRRSEVNNSQNNSIIVVKMVNDSI